MSLQGKRILVTRAAEDRGPFEAMLVGLGAVPVAFPCVEIVDAPDAARLHEVVSRSAPEFVVVASPHAARRIAKVLPFLTGARLAAVGAATAEVLASLGRPDAIVPGGGVGAEALAATLAPLVRGKSILVPRAEGGNPALVQGLAAVGARVTPLTLYRTVTPARPDAEGLRELRAGRIDAIAFASGSAAHGFVELAGKDLFGARVVCMGPLCAAETRAVGLPVDVVSDGGLGELCTAIRKALDPPAPT